MASIHALTGHLLNTPDAKGQARIVKLGSTTVCRAAAQESYYIEDGWVFREHHGKFVECICRTEEIPAAATPDMPVFQLR